MLATSSAVLTEPEWPSNGLKNVTLCPVSQSTQRKSTYSGLADRAARKHPAHAEKLILLGTKMEGQGHFPVQAFPAVLWLL